MKINIIPTLPESTQILIFPFFKDEVDTEKIREVSGIQYLPPFHGDFKEIASLNHPEKPLRIFLLGLGDEKDLPQLQFAFRSLAFRNHKHWDKGVVVDMSHLPVKAIFSLTMGTYLATYQIGSLKTTDKPESNFFDESFELTVLHSNHKAEALAEEGKITAQAMMNMMHLVDSPANIKTPEWIAKYALESAKKYDYHAEILHKEDLEKEGLSALLAVGQGSIYPSVMIKLEYKPENLDSNRPQIGLVGKGITFDTGGISIKPSSNMHYMKSDMGGAAAVIGAIELAARLQLNVHVVGLVPSAENAVDANSVKPGDVINSYSGKTIEIIDTDAEGRLILADALAYMCKNYNPEVIIDLATLTGSSVRTLGYTAAALFSHDNNLVKSLSEIGYRIHERVWQLPLWNDYDSDIQSDIADVRNFSGKPLAGAITAAKFLEYFVKDSAHWAHLDIAGVAFGDSEYTKMKSASAYGVRLLVEYMKKIAL